MIDSSRAAHTTKRKHTGWMVPENTGDVWRRIAQFIRTKAKQVRREGCTDKDGKKRHEGFPISYLSILFTRHSRGVRRGERRYKPV